MGVLRCVDHLLFGAPELGPAIEHIFKLTGVKAAIGGRHLGLGTHNALLSLGGDQYLEIIAPDPDQDPSFIEKGFAKDLVNVPGPGKLFTWCAIPENLDESADSARKGGLAIAEPKDFSRKKPDGSDLNWRLAIWEGVAPVEGLPFLIDWCKATTPARTAPGGCTLKSFTVLSPQPAQVIQWLDVMKLDSADNLNTMVESSSPGFRAVLSTPNGDVELC